MKKPKNVFVSTIVISSILLLAGCAVNGQHTYSDKGQCLTCWNNPLTGKKINHAASDQYSEKHDVEKNKREDEDARRHKEHEERMTKRKNIQDQHLGHWAKFSKPCFGSGTKIDLIIDSKKDVDTVYNRMLREFKLKMQSEVKGVSKMEVFGAKHEVQVGVRYNIIQHNLSHLSARNLKMGFDMEKDGSGTRMYMYYCNGGPGGHTQDDAVFRKSLLQRINKALN